MHNASGNGPLNTGGPSNYENYFNQGLPPSPPKIGVPGKPSTPKQMEKFVNDTIKGLETALGSKKIDPDTLKNVRIICNNLKNDTTINNDQRARLEKVDVVLKRLETPLQRSSPPMLNRSPTESPQTISPRDNRDTPSPTQARDTPSPTQVSSTPPNVPAHLSQSLVRPGHVRALALQAHGVDLKTAQGEIPNRVALQVNACLMTGIANAEQPAMVKIAEGNPNASPLERFTKLISCLDRLCGLVDVNNADDMQLMNELAGLINKSFISGVGCFQYPGIKDEWKKPISFEIEAKPENGAKNIQQLNKVKELLKFLGDHGKEHYTSSATRHSGGVELAGVQLAATFGQLINDVLLEDKMKAKDKLLGVMHQAGLVQPDTFSTVVDLRKQMRANALLAESPNAVIQSQIIEGIKKGTSRAELVSIVKSQMLSYNQRTNTPLQSHEMETLANALIDNFAKKIGDIKFDTKASGGRGRTAATEAKKAFISNVGKNISGAKGDPHSFAVMPNRDDDGFATKWANEAFGSNPKMSRLDEAIHRDKILEHQGSPLNVLRLGTGLDGRFGELIEHPSNQLHVAAKDLLAKPDQLSEAMKDFLLAFAQKTNPERNKEKPTDLIALNRGMALVLGQIPVTYNQATKEAMPLGKFNDLPSVAGLMYDSNLRTICSISGTTVDTVLGLTLGLGKEKMQQALQPLLEFSRDSSKSPSPLSSPGGNQFKELFTSITFFMQSGQYHTAGEVLGGLFIAAIENSGEKLTIEQTYSRFEALMHAFAEHPENFFAMNEQDKAKIQDPQLLRSAQQQLDQNAHVRRFGG